MAGTRKMAGVQGAEKEEDGIQVGTRQELGRWLEHRVAGGGNDEDDVQVDTEQV
jgi:hypothetical protein